MILGIETELAMSPITGTVCVIARLSSYHYHISHTAAEAEECHHILDGRGVDGSLLLFSPLTLSLSTDISSVSPPT